MEARPDLAGLFRLPTLPPRCRSPSHTHLWGIVLIVAGILSFSAFFYAAVLSKLLPSSSSPPFLTAIQNDWYYCLLIPLTGAVIVIAVYLHWLCMKLFKHA